MKDKVILHCDMNNCYASIEQVLNPSLKGKPFIVSGNPRERHGIVLSKSQEAKLLGIQTAETVWKAKEKCPHLLIVPPHHSIYLEYSKKAQNIYYAYTNYVEPYGLDECFLDVTESIPLFRDGRTIAYTIKERIKKELHITVSVGISFNKIFAKLGSDMKKPDAITEIRKDNFKEVVWPLNIDKILGIGRKTKSTLNSHGIFSLGDLAHTKKEHLEKILGKNGGTLWTYANGLDTSPVLDKNHISPPKTIGNGITCPHDLRTKEDVKKVLLWLSLKVSKRLNDYNFQAKSVQVSVKNTHLATKNYQCPLPIETSSPSILTDMALELFKKKYPWDLPVRALTLRASHLQDKNAPKQMSLDFSHKNYEKKEQLSQAIYDIQKKYPKENHITYASLLKSMDTIKKDK